MGHTAAATDQVSDQVTDQVKALLKCLGTKPASALECMQKLGLSPRSTFRQNELQPSLDAGLIERTLPDKPNSRPQKCRRRGVCVKEAFVSLRFQKWHMVCESCATSRKS